MILRSLLALTVTLSLLVSPQLRFPARVSGGGGGGAQMLAADLTLDGAQTIGSTAYASPATGGAVPIAAADRSGLKFFTSAFSSATQPVYELTPHATWVAASSWASSNSMTLTTNWGVIKDSCDTRWNGSAMVALGAYQQGWLYWDAAQSALLSTYHDPYLASVQTNHHVCVTTLDNPGTAASTTYGPFRFKAEVNTGSYKYHSRGYFIFPDSDGGYLIAGNQNTNYSSGTPTGPNLFHLPTLPTTASTPGNAGADFATDASYLDHPSCGGSAFVRTFQRPHDEADHNEPGGWCATAPSGGAATSWMEYDRFAGGIKIDNGQKRAFFAFMVLTGKTGQDPGTTSCTNGHTWYDNPGAGRSDDHGCTAHYSVTGPIATSRFLAVCAYSLDDLEANAADLTTLNSVQPVECVDAETEWGVDQTSVNKADPGSYGCCAVDPINARTFYSITAGKKSSGACPGTNGGDCLSIVWKWGWAASSRPLPSDSDTPLDRILRAVGLKGDWKTTAKRMALHFDVAPSPLPFAAGLAVLFFPLTRARRLW